MWVLKVCLYYVLYWSIVLPGLTFIYAYKLLCVCAWKLLFYIRCVCFYTFRFDLVWHIARTPSQHVPF